MADFVQEPAVDVPGQPGVQSSQAMQPNFLPGDLVKLKDGILGLPLTRHPGRRTGSNTDTAQIGADDIAVVISTTKVNGSRFEAKALLLVENHGRAALGWNFVDYFIRVPTHPTSPTPATQHP